jgi:hypothetical protein
VAGQVLNAASDPVVGAQVVIQFTDDTGEQVEETATTDSTGRFNERIDIGDPTEVVITVSKKGWMLSRRGRHRPMRARPT